MVAEITAIIPTLNRAPVLQRTFESLALQELQPAEIIVVDASDNDETEKVCSLKFPKLDSVIIYERAREKGAAAQRNQAFERDVKPVIFFMDDDIIFEPLCTQRLWNCIQSDKRIGAVNSMVTNQRYLTPGKLTRFMYRIMHGKNLSTYAGKVIGPAWNLLPEDQPNLPECVEMEWVNTTCTMYRKEALPMPPFPSQFKGYSMMEDVTLSLIMARNWKLYNARTARLFHDSQPGIHKNNHFKMSKMELVNRHYVVTKILKKKNFSTFFKMFILEVFGITTALTTLQGWKHLLPVLGGKFSAIAEIIFSKRNKE
ncbi:MAG: glycosyltransferase family 2 protein [Ferruginibacter sp.]